MIEDNAGLYTGPHYMQGGYMILVYGFTLAQWAHGPMDPWTHGPMDRALHWPSRRPMTQRGGRYAEREVWVIFRVMGQVRGQL